MTTTQMNLPSRALAKSTVLRIEVITRVSENANGIALNDFAPQHKVINFHDSSDRQWLAKHSWWAMHNQMEVLTRAL